MQDQMTNLEIKLAYQEDLIQELNEVVITLQKDNIRLNNEFTKLRELVTQSLAPNIASSDEETPPPHY